MIALLAVLAAAPAVPAPSAPAASPPAVSTAHAGGDTRCSACHSTSGWKPVKFDHSRTGFALEGRHLSASCSGCHRAVDFSVPAPTSCAACHKDVHTGEFGSRCSSCHDARDWGSRFDAAAHQRTGFPLTGRHAAIPCEECHLEQRDRRFTRATAGCYDCHQADYARTAAAGLDHARAGLGTDCKACHFPSRFQGALFPAHRACFQIDAGPHGGITCLHCHTSLSTTAVTGSCSGTAFSCQQCHACTPSLAGQHNGVDGFQCKDAKCYECHKFTSTSAVRPRQRGGAR